MVVEVTVVDNHDKILIEAYQERCEHFKSHIENQEFLIVTLVSVIVAVTFLTVNYYSNVDKDKHYAEIYGELRDGEWSR